MAGVFILWLVIGYTDYYVAVQQLIYGYSLTRLPELYMPYWPFEPWFAVALAGSGAYLLSGRLARQ